jgi:hypothetical protein
MPSEEQQHFDRPRVTGSAGLTNEDPLIFDPRVLERSALPELPRDGPPGISAD